MELEKSRRCGRERRRWHWKRVGGEGEREGDGIGNE